MSGVGQILLGRSVTAGAVAVDGATGSAITRVSAFAGSGSGPLFDVGTLSLWIRRDASGAFEFLTVDSAPGPHINIGFDAADKGRNVLGDTGVAAAVNGIYTNIHAQNAAWKHLLFSWDVSASVSQLYVNDVADTFTGSFDTGDNLPWTLGNWSINVTNLAEFYLNDDVYIDLSAESNRRKFISAAGKPVSLGADGSAPTGSAPLVFLHLDNGEAPANFAINRGTGGNLSITGTLTTATTSPSD